MRRALAALTVLAALTAAPAAHAQLLAPADATELANRLADAAEEQGVCYGWQVRISGPGAPPLPDVGSNGGPGRPVAAVPGCTDRVELTVDILYTSESSESEDRASFGVSSTIAEAADAGAQLRALGYDEGDLLGNDDDTTVVNMAGALPSIVAELAGKPYVEFEKSTTPTGAEGAPTGTPGNDFVREHVWALVFGVALIVLGLGWWAFARAGRLVTTRAQARQR